MRRRLTVSRRKRCLPGQGRGAIASIEIARVEFARSRGCVCVCACDSSTNSLDSFLAGLIVKVFGSPF